MFVFIKRIYDLFFSILGIIILIPLFLPIIVILRLTSEKEIFYLQERVGQNKKVFKIIKFATMLKDSPNIGGGALTLRNDPRITPFGKILRITKINELPQIINVLKGDMSLVGPRPILTKSFKKYSKNVQNIISKNKPGITGIGSLVFRDEEKLASEYRNIGKDPLDYYHTYIYPYKGDLELWYYNNKSFWTDIKILILTFWLILNSRSQLVFKWFSNLPEKPFGLNTADIQKMR